MTEPTPAARPNNPRASWARRKAEELLADGEWHDREKIIEEIMGVIPPNVAYHHAENVRGWQYRRDHNLSPDDPVPPRRNNKGEEGMDRVIQAGRRDLARRAVARGRDTKNTRIEHHPENPNLIRLRPLKLPPLEVRQAAARQSWATRLARNPNAYEDLKEAGRRRSASGAARESAIRAAQTKRQRGTSRTGAVKAYQTRLERYGPDPVKVMMLLATQSRSLRHKWKEYR